MLRSLLAPVTDLENQKGVLGPAFHLAQRFNGHLTALCIRPDPRAAIPFMGEGLTADAIQDLIAAAEREAQDRADSAREIFEKEASAAGIPFADGMDSSAASVAWVECVGMIEERAGRAARLADLTIVPQPVHPHPPESTDILTDVLFKSGRPLLIAPPKIRKLPGETVLLAWNGRAEGARTAAAAIPLLQKARKVTLLTIGDEHPDRPRLRSLQTYLARHGIRAETETRERGSGVGETILSAADDMEADLLVMGAYSHSRWREMVMGGVTRHAIHNADIPVFMSH